MKTSSILCLLLSLCACSKPTVRCDTRLEPINAPRPGPAKITAAPPNPAPAQTLAGARP